MRTNTSPTILNVSPRPKTRAGRVLFWILALLLISGSSLLQGATLTTDRLDYPPGSYVTFTGTGWTPGEKVAIDVWESSSDPDLFVDSLIAVADAAGSISNSEFYVYQSFLGLGFLAYAVGQTSGATATAAFTDAAAASLEQYRNGAVSDPITETEALAGGAGDIGWVSGNAGANNSHYAEGQSIPYRAIMTGLPTGVPITLIIGYDVKNSGRNAIDYLTHYNRLLPHSYTTHSTAESVYPTADITDLSATVDTEPIPAPSSAGSPVAGQPTASFNALFEGEKLMTLYGGSIQSITYATHGSLTAAQSESQLAVRFTADSTTAVLAWGGNIASRSYWGYDGDGEPYSAGGINGSPFHMRLIDWYGDNADVTKLLGNLGNQDRSLSTDAVVPPCSITGPGAVCAGSGAQFCGPAGTGETLAYLWSVTGAGTISGPANLACVNVEAGASGSYTVELQVYNGSLGLVCSQTVLVKPLPACAISGGPPDDIVYAGSQGLMLSGPGSSTDFDYLWSVSGSNAGSVTVVGDLISPQLVLNVDSVTLGETLTITLALTDKATGCQSACSRTFTVYTLDAGCLISGPLSVAEGSVNAYSLTAPASTSLITWSLSPNTSGATFDHFDPGTPPVSEIAYVNAGLTAAGYTVNALIVYPGGTLTCSLPVTVVNVPPTIQVIKTANPTAVPETGGNVTFTFVVKNTSSEEPVTITSLSDSVYGTLAGDDDCKVGTVLAAGAACEFSFTTWVEGDYSGPNHVDVFTAKAVDNENTEATDSDDATVDFENVLPAIEVTKLANPTAVPETGGNVTFTFVVKNTSSEEPVTITSLSDSLYGTLAGDDDCKVGTVLAAGASCEFSFTQWVEGDFSGPDHVNVFTAKAVDNDNTEATDSDDATVDFTDVAPMIDLTKTVDPLTMLEPGGVFTYTLTIKNTSTEEPVTITSLTDDNVLSQGCLELVGTTLAAGASVSCTYTVTHSEAGTYPNTAAVVVKDNDNTEASDSDDETVTVRPAAKLNVRKLTNGQVNSLKNWTFSLYQFGATTPLETLSTLDDQDGLIEFSTYLDPEKTYTLRENTIPAGWSAIWTWSGTILVTYNPDYSSDPNLNEDLGNRCFDIGAGTGLPLPAGGMAGIETLLIDVNNNYPAGEPRTPGYWKNWNYCTGGGQATTAEQNGAWQSGFWLVEHVLDYSIGGGITWDDILTDNFVVPITVCAVAVDILDQRDIGDPSVPYDGRKHSSDAAYTLAMHLLAAQLNKAAGAAWCPNVDAAVLEAETLLDELNFNGAGNYLTKPNNAYYARALQLATMLDNYNNGWVCGLPNVAITSPADGAAVSGMVPITATVDTPNTVLKVEFFVDGASLGADTVGADGWSLSWNTAAYADGSHTITVVATDNMAKSGSQTITVAKAAGVKTLHVAAMVGSAKLSKTTWTATVTVTIHDNGDALVPGATVYGSWDGGLPVALTTGANGTAAFSLKNIPKTTGAVTFEVKNVAPPAAFTYASGDNHQTSETVQKP